MEYIWHGEKHTLKEIAATTGISDACIRKRMERGQTVDEATSYPARAKTDNRYYNIRNILTGQLIAEKLPSQSDVAAALGLSRSYISVCIAQKGGRHGTLQIETTGEILTDEERFERNFIKEFTPKWEAVCMRLWNSGADLSRIYLTEEKGDL